MIVQLFSKRYRLRAGCKIDGEWIRNQSWLALCKKRKRLESFMRTKIEIQVDTDQWY